MRNKKFHSISRIDPFLKYLLDQIVYICSVKSFFQIVFVVIILGGSLGIPVYQHTCLSENKSEHALFVNTTECHDDEEQHESMACCQPEKLANTAEEGCCTDEVSAYKISFFKQYQTEFQFSPFDFPSENALGAFNFSGFRVSDTEVLAFADLPPPKLQKRLALFQVWRI